jgi:hypothetical protein
VGRVTGISLFNNTMEFKIQIFDKKTVPLGLLKVIRLFI